MKTVALTSTVLTLAAASLCGQSQSDVDFLRARADAQERKIGQLEKELNRLKGFHTDSAPAVASGKSSLAGKARTYVVRRGDVLSRIAYRHKTTVAAIIKANKLRNDRIRVGQKLRIPGAAAPAPKAVPVREESTSSGATRMAAKPAAGKHIVKRGETFYSIARRYKVTVKSLMAANPRVKPTMMRAGQALVINGGAKAVAKKSRPARKPVAKHPAPKRKAPASRATEYVDPPKPREVVRSTSADHKPSPAPSPEPSIRTITVNQQMTYGQFASKYGASTTQLNALNGLRLSKNTMLAKGSELYVPKY